MTKSKLITVIPIYNGQDFILQTLESVAAQKMQPSRVVVLDNGSTDKSEELVRSFKPLRCEWQSHGKNIGALPNFNYALGFGEQTDYLHLLCADDCIHPEFYSRLTRELDSCKGRGLAYSLDERIDQDNKRLSLSGKVTGRAEVLRLEDFLKEKAEIANQAFSASLLKTAGQKVPCEFREEYPMLADMVFWPDWARLCERIVRVREPLAQYRWHGANGTWELAPTLNLLVLDEWRVMQLIEQWRGGSSGFVRQFKLKGLFGVRAGIKAKRFRQIGNVEYSRQIVQAARPVSGPLAWYMAQAMVEAREFFVYTLGFRKRHPRNIHG